MYVGVIANGYGLLEEVGGRPGPSACERRSKREYQNDPRPQTVRTYQIQQQQQQKKIIKYKILSLSLSLFLSLHSFQI